MPPQNKHSLPARGFRVRVPLLIAEMVDGQLTAKAQQAERITPDAAQDAHIVFNRDVPGYRYKWGGDEPAPQLSGKNG